MTTEDRSPEVMGTFDFRASLPWLGTALRQVRHFARRLPVRYDTRAERAPRLPGTGSEGYYWYW